MALLNNVVEIVREVFFFKGVYSPRRMLPVYLHGIKYIQIQYNRQQTRRKEKKKKINNQQKERRVKEQELKTCLFISLKNLEMRMGH